LILQIIYSTKYSCLVLESAIRMAALIILLLVHYISCMF